MKVSITLLAFLLIASTARSTDWEWVYPHPAGLQYPYLSLALDGSVWSVGDNGEVIRSMDGGRKFSRLTPVIVPYDDHRRELAAFSKDVAVISFYNGDVIQTLDAGMSWQQFSLPDSHKVVSLCYAKDGTLWMTCTNNNILQYDHGSVAPIEHKVLAAEKSAGLIRAFGNVILCGAANAVWHRYENGEWHRYLMSEDQRAYGFAILEDNICVITPDSIISLYPQFEKRFSLPAPGYAATRNGMNFVAQGGQVIYSSTDGAASWSSAIVSRYDIGHVIWTSDSTIVAGAVNGLSLFSADTGKTWTPSYASIPQFDQFKIHENGAIYAFMGRVHRSLDGGYSWTHLGTSDWGIVDDVRFLNDSTWYLRRNESVNVTTDAGKTWQKSMEWYRFFYERVSGDTLFAHEYADDNRNDLTYIFQSTNNGVGWDTIVRFSERWRYAAFAPGGVIVLSDVNTRFYYSHDYGKTWSEKNFPLLKVILSDDNGLLWGGSQPSRIHSVSTDKGETWKISSTNGSCLLPLTFGSKRYYTTTENGIHHSDDSGKSWQLDSFQLSMGRPHRIQVSPNGWVYGTTNGDVLVRYRAGNPVSVAEDDHVQQSLEEIGAGTVHVYAITGQRYTSLPSSMWPSFLQDELPNGLWLCVENTASSITSVRKLSVIRP